MKIKAILASVLALGLCACTSDDVLTESVDNASAGNESVYMKFSVSLPTTGGTRSATTSTEAVDEDGNTIVDEDGNTIYVDGNGNTIDYVESDDGLIEVGQDYENDIKSLFVVLTERDDDNTFIASVEASINDDVLTKVSDEVYVLAIDRDKIEDHAGEEVNVYVYCNTVGKNRKPSISPFSVDNINTITDADDDEVWEKNNMLMSNANAKTSVATLPSESDLDSYTTVDNPCDLGSVEVERSFARFDYKDGGTDGNYTYNVGSLYNGDDDPIDVSVTLTHVALLNESKSFYYLRRTASDDPSSTNTENPSANLSTTYLLGVETNNNWVIDTDAADKLNYAPKKNGLSGNFYYPVETTYDAVNDMWSVLKLSDLQWTSLSSIANNDKDIDETWNSDETYGEYHIWRYVTENTIPSVEDQKNGISTGMVFKGTINVTGVADGTTLYVFGNIVYAGWDAVKAAVAAGEETSPLAVAYAKVTEITKGDEPDSDDLLEADAGIAAYAPNDVGDYEVYYYYWNRHNDNGVDEVMGRMEFAVVRNNVYKLSVTKINKFGYPEYDTPDPDTPDETTEYYFKLDVKILPWVVRVNNITF